MLNDFLRSTVKKLHVSHLYSRLKPLPRLIAVAECVADGAILWERL